MPLSSHLIGHDVSIVDGSGGEVVAGVDAIEFLGLAAKILRVDLVRHARQRLQVSFDSIL